MSTPEAIAEIKANLLLLKAYTGVSHPDDIYMKTSPAGRNTYHRFSDDGIINQAYLPSDFFDRIVHIDCTLDKAREYSKALALHTKIKSHVADAVADVAKWNMKIESQKPADYNALLVAHQRMKESHPYYYVSTFAGMPIYYDNCGKRVKKTEIPATLAGNIPFQTAAMSKALEIKEAEAQKAKCEARLANLQDKLGASEKQCALYMIPNYKEVLDAHAKNKVAWAARAKERHSKWTKEFFSSINSDETRKRQKMQEDRKEDAWNVLLKVNISTKSEWRKWLGEHHPDKGGNKEIATRVIDAGKLVFDNKE